MKHLRATLTAIAASFAALSPAHAGAPLPGVNHVVVIGFDGFGAYAWPKAEMPRLKALAKSGSYTLTAISVLPSSSAQNWASHFMGAGPESHHYTDWNSARPTKPIDFKNKYGMYPGIFGELRIQHPDAKIGIVHNWDGIRPLVEKEAADYCVQTQTMEQTAVLFSNYLKKEKPALAFVHFNEPDNTGHGPGHDTPQYYAALKDCDKQLGRVLDAINEAGMKDDTVVMIIADHGGINKGHGGISAQERCTPWIIAGPGVKAGYGITGPVSVTDTAPTLAKVMGLTPPAGWTGKAVNEVFKNTDKAVASAR